MNEWGHKVCDMFRKRRNETSAVPNSVQSEPKSPMELYAASGGAMNPRTAAILWEAEKTHRLRRDAAVRPAERERPRPIDPLHAHEVSPADAALMRMMTGASFGSDATVTLPSGRTITGREMQQWVDANDQNNGGDGFDTGDGTWRDRRWAP